VPHTFLVPVNKITAIYHIISRVKELDVLKRFNCCFPPHLSLSKKDLCCAPWLRKFDKNRCDCWGRFKLSHG